MKQNPFAYIAEIYKDYIHQYLSLREEQNNIIKEYAKELEKEKANQIRKRLNSHAER